MGVKYVVTIIGREVGWSDKVGVGCIHKLLEKSITFFKFVLG